MDEKFESKGRVCVTVASGFIASWLIKRLLLSGYRVIGTVREPGNNEKLRHLWKLEGAKERLELVRADLMEEGSFDDAIMGCHGKTEKFHCHGRMGYVHIDDVAPCHILAYEHENAHGRYLCSSIVVDNNELVSVLSRRYPTLPIPKRFEALDRPYYELNTSKLRSLGFKFKCIEEMFDDCIASLMAQGHLCLA
ncbi:hypothetical protein HYC85_023516 [Camellia sinensis]|uniref:NAD-dependent epimerase/dehydratase domain-containing protein n=1 Tax=Camellia sinensis TaxID=4442 RepID=A0A7J7GFJ5_CAMSI|nr:hypothetical protein HYC85_023516 [Camellia sinensis]